MKKFTLTIAIPAHNEAGTIGQVVLDVRSQKLPPWAKLQRVVVFSDGSTDSTVKEVQKVKDKYVQVIDRKTQRGKNACLNELFRTVKTDLLVLFDADIRLDNKRIVTQLITPFLNRSRLGLVAGNPQPLLGSTWVERAANNWTGALVDIRGRFRNGDSPYCACGPTLALSRPFYKDLLILPEAPSDRYLYFACKQKEFEFYYAQKAIVWFGSAKTIEEHVSQSRRYSQDYINLEKIVGREKAQIEFRLPLVLKLRLLVAQVVRDPSAYLFMKYLHVLVRTSNKPSSVKIWQPVQTSKQLSTNHTIRRTYV